MEAKPCKVVDPDGYPGDFRNFVRPGSLPGHHHRSVSLVMGSDDFFTLPGGGLLDEAFGPDASPSVLPVYNVIFRSHLLFTYPFPGHCQSSYQPDWLHGLMVRFHYVCDPGSHDRTVEWYLPPAAQSEKTAPLYRVN